MTLLGYGGASESSQGTTSYLYTYVVVCEISEQDIAHLKVIDDKTGYDLFFTFDKLPTAT